MDTTHWDETHEVPISYMYHLSQIKPEDLPVWQAFVDGHPQASPHHHAAWYNVLQDCFTVKLEYWCARDAAGDIVGVLPMFLSRSRLAGTHLSTLEGGALTRSDEARLALYTTAARRAKELGSGYFLIRGGDDVDVGPSRTTELKRTIVDLKPGPEALWRGWDSDHRNHIRKASRHGLVCQRDEGAMPGFYAVYARRLRDLGTPVESARFFQSLLHHFGSRLRLHVVLLQGSVIGGMICIETAGSWSYVYGAADARHFRTHPMEALFWFTIREACAVGVQELDLGTSAAGTGAQRFKERWGTRTAPVRYRYIAAAAKVPVYWTDKYRRGRTLEQRLWSHLPRRVALALGPVLRRKLPFA